MKAEAEPEAEPMNGVSRDPVELKGSLLRLTRMPTEQHLSTC
jgi:hypothetical protein